MLSLKDVVDACLIPMGRYSLQMLVPEGVPAHELEFKMEGEALVCVAVTEHGPQKVKTLRLNGRELSWRMLGGTPGTELFEYKMRLYNEGVMLGCAWRADVPPDEAAESPCIARRIQ